VRCGNRGAPKPLDDSSVMRCLYRVLAVAARVRSGKLPTRCDWPRGPWPCAGWRNTPPRNVGVDFAVNRGRGSREMARPVGMGIAGSPGLTAPNLQGGMS
jgi:hypothetical protein